MGLPKQVVICECTGRDGLQHEPSFIPTPQKGAMIDRFTALGYKATCVNAVAVRRAVKAAEAGFGPTEISMVVIASEQQSVAQLGKTHAVVRADLDQVISEASTAAMRVVGTIAGAFGSRPTGPTTDAEVKQWVPYLRERGIRAAALGDTTGMANPAGVERRCAYLKECYPDMFWVGHFHDTRGAGLANCVAALHGGFDGLGSCFGGLTQRAAPCAGGGSC